VIDQLRKEKLSVQEARKFGVAVRDSDVDEAYATMASRVRLTPEQMTGQLVSTLTPARAVDRCAYTTTVSRFAARVTPV
jgi:hypothetical protein